MLRGEDINIGLGLEASRGTGVTPQIWIPGKSPTGVDAQIDKVNIRETRASKMASSGSEVVQKKGGGALEFYLRNNSIGYILESLCGQSSVSTLSSGVYEHTFTILANNPEHPSLTLALSRPGDQDFEFALALAKVLGISVDPADLVMANAEFLSASEGADHADYSPVFGSDDYYFRHQDVTLKLATNLAGLSGASAISVKTADMSVDNKARTNQNVSELNAGNVIAGDFEIGGNISLDYVDETYRDIFVAGAYRALQLKMERADIDLGGGNSPSLEINLPRISFSSREEERPIEDIVKEGIGYQAHWSEADSLGIQVKLVSETADYTNA